MAINLKFDLMGNPEPPSIVLANRNGNKLGQLDVDVNSIDLKDSMKTSEFSFTLNKYFDGKLTNLWDKVVDFKLVYCPEWDLWYEIKVELDEATETVKTVFCVQLGQAELSQIMVYNTEINTEDDIARDDYKISVLYDENDKKASVFHRVMSKAPHYSIAYVDESLKRIQRSFSFDDSSICDVFDEIEEEVGCLVVYNSNSDKKGMPKRDISVFDLYQHCGNCGHREEVISGECPKCHSKNIIDGYGKDTTIFVTSDELATEGIQLVTDTDSIKNCFKLEAGDDLMTATIRNCNPNGSDYIWYFSDAVKEDMSNELVEAIENYNTKYKEYYESHVSNLDEDLINKYNSLVEKYKKYYNTKSTCINCGHEDYFENECPKCNSKNILSGKNLQSVHTSIVGYPALINAYYNTIDLALFLESGLMPTPNVEVSDTTAKEQLELLISSTLSPVAVNVENINNVSLVTADTSVLSMAKVVVKPTYKVQIKSSSLSADKQLWSGQFVVTNYSDETDTASNNNDEYISVTINNNTKEFIQQKIEKTLNKESTDDYSVSGLFKKSINLDQNGEHIVDENGNCQCEFCTELKKYALNPLDSFYKSCDSCISILTEQGAGNKDEKPELYKDLYLPYYRKSQSIAKEMKERENEIAIIEGIYDETDKENKTLITEGLQTNIEKCQKAIQEELDFEQYLKNTNDFLGSNLWLEFCSYRREDKYSNPNYVSDGLNNAELFDKALEFIDVAENEIFKSAELQHSISTTLNNLLAYPKFKSLLKYFKTGNWIRVQVDDKIYKLRLLEYNFSYGDSNNIPVEFSDVTKVKNGITDVASIVSQAASMASSYNSVQRQAKKGDVARSTIDEWLVDGLNAANVQIQSNNSEEVLLTKNGLLARSYIDITGEYSPEQLKITHNIMAYTDDNWQTVKQAIGKHNYKLYDVNEGNFVDKIGYGMNSDFVNAGIVSGSQIIGGDIYSDNYSITDRTGSYLNLRDGTFSFGGGSLRYEGGKLIISSPDIPTTDTITEINEEYLKTTSVYAQNLQVKAANIQEKLVASQINADGIEANNVDISGIINAEKGGTIASFNIDDASIYNGTNSLTSTDSGIYLGIDGIRQYKSSEANVTISNGVLDAQGAKISGDIIATSGTFTNGTFNDCVIESSCTIKGKLSGLDGTFIGTVEGGTIKGGDIIGTDIQGGSLYIGDDDNCYAWISKDGVLNANGVNISGLINAVDGNIAGWQITSDALYKNIYGISSGMCSIPKASSEGLEYTLDDDESSYIVSGIGDCEDIDIVIPSIHNDKTVTKIGDSAFLNNTNIRSVTISDNVFDIGYRAFFGCSKLVNVMMPDSVVTIGEQAFAYCKGITSITIPDGVRNIENYAFQNCTNLIRVIIPISVTHIGNLAFVNCDNVVFYCESTEQMEDWSSNWCPESSEIIWDYLHNYDFGNYDSLVMNGATSCPRFYAGSDFNMPLSTTDARFLVLEDGSLYASAAKISGTINADNGYIGNLNIAGGGLEYSKNDNRLYYLNDSGLVLEKNTAKIRVGDLSLGYDTTEENTIIQTSGHLIIRGDNSTQIEFMKNRDGENVSSSITLHYQVITPYSGNSSYSGFQTGKIWITSESPLYPVTIDVEWENGYGSDSGIIPLTINAKQDISNAVTFEFDCTGYNQNIRFRTNSGNWTNYVGDNANKDDEFTFDSFVSFSQSSSPNNLYITGNLLPSIKSVSDDTGYNLGNGDEPWNTIFARNGSIQPSDRNKKNTIQSLSNAYSQIFDSLKPVSYKFNVNNNNRTHIGFIAQDVKSAIENAGLTTQDLAAYCEWEENDGVISCGLRYSEFIALCVDEIQKLKKRVKELEQKI